MGLIDMLQERLGDRCPTIVFPEGDDAAIIEGAAICRDRGICKPVILVRNGKLASEGIDMTGIEIIDPDAMAEKKAAYAALYEELEDFPAEAVVSMLNDPLDYALMMCRAGDADGMVGGHIYDSDEVISKGKLYVGLADGVELASSYNLLEVPDWDGGERMGGVGHLTAFADCVLVVQPSSLELANIARNAAHSVQKLLGWEPKVGMLSFSTKGSAKHADVDKVVEATRILKELEPDMIVDGELQLDAAIMPKVYAKKTKAAAGSLGGLSNVVVFPDLDAGNIGCKLVQLYAHANMYGAILCGFRKPFIDLSRSMSVTDIVGAAVIVAAQC